MNRDDADREYERNSQVRSMSAAEATNYLVAQLAGQCEPLEIGTEVRYESESSLVVTLPEENGGDVRPAEFVITIQRRSP